MEENKRNYFKTRRYSAHHFLLNVAQDILEGSKEHPDRYDHFDVAIQAMLYSALALEAIANSFGDRLYQRWQDDFESTKLHGKLRLVAYRLKVEYDTGKQPWGSVKEIVSFRNKLVHPKPEHITVTKSLTKEEYKNRFRYEWPRAKLEQEVSLDKADRFLKCVLAILDLFLDQMDYDQSDGLDYDSVSGGSTL